MVTVCTRAEGCTTALLYSNAILNTHLTLLGWGEACGGPGWRLKKVVDFCKEVELDDVVVVVDGFNSVILQPREVILEKFLEFGGRIVCMGQQDAHYRQSRLSLHIPPVQSAAAQNSRACLTVLNAGAFAAYARDIIRLFADAPEELSQHVLLGELYQAQPDLLVTIDTNCSLFHRYRSPNDLTVLTYADAHAQSIHAPPNLPSTSGRSLPSSSGAPCSPPFFRPSPLPRIAMDAVTRETPCLVHIPRSRNADAFLRQLGLPSRSVQLGVLSLIPRCCREFVHKYKKAVLPPTAQLDRLVSWLFIVFFISAEILGLLSLRGILAVAVAVIPQDAPEEVAGSFFVWRQGTQKEAAPRDLHRTAEAAILTAVSAVCEGVHHLYHFCLALSWVWILSLVMSGLGLLGVAAWSSLLSRRPETVSGGQSPHLNRVHSTASEQAAGACAPEETAEKFASTAGPASYIGADEFLQDSQTTYLQHLLQEQASLACMRKESALLGSLCAEGDTQSQDVGGERKSAAGRQTGPRRQQRSPSLQGGGARRRRGSLKRQSGFLTESSTGLSSGSSLDDSGTPEPPTAPRGNSERAATKRAPSKGAQRRGAARRRVAV
ncbi:hypothetical protein NCLIV_007820 [Neospora caninum Liverpool]|nr:hypothetical protein NCLIV_007820 [Neospora caninum Liverpool]CBZ50308.1 hypothetical protein NCLIV_007820 [Neospora caninum Liverpool]|eukprot:XP_003880342.1 hypothetical protein NCLIV_007820 [Neospora caninum Liverpool]